MNLSEELIRTLLAIDGLSINVTLVGGAVGGQTVAQGDPNAGGVDAWPTTDAAAQALLTTIAARLADLAPPVGGTIIGDDAAHAFGTLTGPGILVVAASGGTARIGAAADVSASVGIPVIDGAAYDAGGRRYADIAANKVYVPVGCTVLWGAHQ